MSAESLKTIVEASPAAIAAAPAVAVGHLYAALLADARGDRTRRARVQDVADLARFLGRPDPELAAAAVVAGGAGPGNALALAYRAHMQARGLAAATINRRLSTVRRVVELARRFGLADWALDVEGLRAAAYRDTTGPGREGFQRLRAAAADAGDTPKARRDRALLRLLHDLGLRRGEVLALDVEDFDAEGGRVAVLGKGRADKEWLSLNEPTARALREWLDARGHHPGPLFINFDRSDKPGAGGRLTGDGLAAVLRALSRRAGLARPARPHGLRHQGISRALDLTNGNIRLVQRFARHADPKTTQRYDDNREDLAGVVTRLLGTDG